MCVLCVFCRVGFTNTLGIPIKNKALYKLRSETIERVFADAKEKHRMRYTQYRGRSKVAMEISLIYSCMNLKKLAVWISKVGNKPDNPSKIASILIYCIISGLIIAAIKVEEPCHAVA